MATSASTEITLEGATNADSPQQGETPHATGPPRFKLPLTKSPPSSLQSGTPVQYIQRFPGTSFKLSLSPANSVDYGGRTNSIPWQKCFTELPSMSQLLREVQIKDSEFTQQLQAIQAADRRSRRQTQSPGSEFDVEDPNYLKLVVEYREFVESFISLFLQSKFISFSGGIEPSSDPHGIILTLVSSKKCPELVLFCRVLVNPTYIASDLPDSENPAVVRRIPVNHLARFCDIAVLRFLSSVSEHTHSLAVVWALDYLTNLLNSLITSLNSLSAHGWYGAPPVRIKKGTTVTRHSATCPPPGFVPPPVVVVGTPPPEEGDVELDPETGQPSPRLSPDLEHPQNVSLSAKAVSEQTSQHLQQHRGSTSSVGDDPTRTGAPATRPRRRNSRQESQGRLKPNYDQVSDKNSSRKSSSSSATSILSSGSLVPPTAVSTSRITPARRHSPTPNSSPFSRVSPPRTMGSIPEESTLLRMGSIEREYFEMMKSQGDSFEEDVSTNLPRDEEQVPRLVPSLEGLPKLDNITEIEEDGLTSSMEASLGDKQSFETARLDAVRTKPSPPLEPGDIPEVDVKRELETLINGEGRISLIAILHAIASLPGVPTVWTEEVGLKCFSVIQLCMNLGLAAGGEDKDDPSKKGPVSAQSRRKLFQKGKNPAFKKIGVETPSRVYSKLIVEHAIYALIQCATSMIIGCTIDTGLCQLTYRHLPNQSRQVHNKLLRNLRRLHLHSPTTFRHVIADFASTVSCRKLFHFLHVVLQYCIQGRQHFQMDSLLVAITASVLRISVDKLVQLDINEPSIQSSIVVEACSFFQYANSIFSQETLSQIKSFTHLHHYIHRIALSILLPPRPAPPEVTEVTESPLSDESIAISEGSDLKADTLPRKRAPKLATDSDPRKRAGSLHLPQGEPQQAQSQLLGKGIRGANRRVLPKQTSVHSDPDQTSLAGPGLASSAAPKIARANVQLCSEPVKEWRGLKLGVLRSRIQRLVVLMNTSEPGTVPEAGMLASLIDLGTSTSVVARAMVLLECALFVSNLRSQDWPTPWLYHNTEGGHNLCMHLKKWGEAISEKLRLLELRERETLNRLRITSGRGIGGDPAVFLPEEPVFPNESDEGREELGETISYAVKMAACILLLEITRFLRNPPPQYVGLTSLQSTPRVSITTTDRKPSNASNYSSDTEALRTGGMLSPGVPLARPMSEHGHPHPHYGSNLSIEDPEVQTKSLSFDEVSPSASPRRKKRVSVYLRVNSAGGGGSGVGVNRSSSIRKQTVAVRFVDAPGESRPLHGSPSFRRRKQSVTVSATASTLQKQLAAVNNGGGGAQNFQRRSSTSAGGGGAAVSTIGTFHPQAAIYKRKSVGAPLFKEQSSSELDQTRPPLQSQASTTSNKSVLGGASALGSSINAGFSKLRRSAQRAFRHYPTRRKAGKGDTGTLTQGSSGNSPNLTQRKRQQRFSQAAGSFSQSLFLLEDNRKHYPWLDVIEHLMLVDAFDPHARKRHKQACSKLIAALKQVYASTAPEPEEDSQELQQDETRRSISRKSLAAIFTGALLQGEEAQGGLDTPTQSLYSRNVSMPAIAIKRRSSAKATLRYASVSNTSLGSRLSLPSIPLASINFNTYAQYTSSFLAATSGNEEGSVELFLEGESAFMRPHLTADADRERWKYIHHTFSGLMHAPFSLLVHTASILHLGTFATLKEVAWETLLDSDHELSQAAASFFLLATAKESDVAIKVFIQEKVQKVKPGKKLEAIQRFMVLWRARYGVWPRMEERAQKKFNPYTEKEDRKADQQSIGYSLPANLLGSSGQEIPFPPWESASICTGKSCSLQPDKCYRPTHLAPILHRDEISEQVKSYSVSGVSMTQEASSKPANVFLGTSGDDAASTGKLNWSDLQWEAVEPTLFPPSLLPFIRFLILELHPSPASGKTPHPSPPTSSASLLSQSEPQDSEIIEAARDAVWTCMVEDPRLFFRPLLNQFNKLYRLVSDRKSKTRQIDQLLADILRPLHMVLRAFPTLPPRAAHFLFNNLVGIITRHTDQPYAESYKVIQSVLSLIGMVTLSVQGLDSKGLKGILKKESCYTTIMTTARIRGVEKVQLALDPSFYDRRLYDVTGDMTFGQLIADERNEPQISVELLQKWYLTEEGKELPILSNLVVQDHYSVPADGHYPTFILRRAGEFDNVWTQQMDQLFLYKMSEVMRVLLTTRLLQTGPGVEKGFRYSEFAQPNNRFIHLELIELNSFPRKALTSILYEAGPSALQNKELRASDIMLKGMWARFVLKLFTSVKPEYEWSNSMVLFLNVVSGALLLHCEDHTILRTCLAALLTAASKFHAVFRKDGYQMIVPTLVQVYALHTKNSLVTKAIEFVWCHFYFLHSNVFLLQAIAAMATMLSDEAALLSRNVGSTFTAFPRSHIVEGEDAQKTLSRTIFDLLDALNVDAANLPPDELDILGCCPQDHEGWQKLQGCVENWSRLTLQNVVFLCITLARWNPEALRGVQVLVFMDHLSPLILQAFSAQPSLSGFAFSSIRQLIKGCETLAKQQTWRGDILTTRKQAGPPPDPANPPPEGNPGAPTRHVRLDVPRPSVVAQGVQRFRRLINPNRGDTVSGSMSLSEGSVVHRHTQAPVQAPNPTRAQMDHWALSGEFKQRRIQDLNQRIIRLSRESLLSLASRFMAHVTSREPRGVARVRRDSTSKQERQRLSMDPQSVLLLSTVAIQLLKQGGHNEIILQNRGLNSFMTEFLPCVEWSEAYYASFHNILARVLKLFKKYQNDTNKALLVYENLAGFISGITRCIRRCPFLVVGHDQHFTKLKQLLESILSVNAASVQHGLGHPRRLKAVQHHLLHSAPGCFSEAVVELATELICVTQAHTHDNPRFRYWISDLLSHKLTIKEQKETIIHKILLPLCIQLGLREDIERPSEVDAGFVLQIFDKEVENVLKIARSPGHPSQHLVPAEPFFRSLKVICCSFSECFTLQEWQTIAHWVLSLAQRRLKIASIGSGADSRKKMSVSSSESDLLSNRRSRQSVTAGSSGHSVLETFVRFHLSLLNFFESFLLVYRVPLFSLLWPLLGQLEVQLKTVLQSATAVNPALCRNIRGCLEKCRSLQQQISATPPSTSKHMLLRGLQEELKEFSYTSRTLTRSHTAKETKAQPRPIVKQRRSSIGPAALSFSSPLAKIGEEREEMDALQSPPGGTTATVSDQKSYETRPNFLGLGSPPAKEEPKKQITETEDAEKKRRISADGPPRHHHRPLAQLKRPYIKKRFPLRTLSPQSEDSPSESPRKKPPPLAQLRGLYSSSECPADTEDFDVPTPKHSPPLRLVIPNRDAPVAGAKEKSGNQVTVFAEVYESEEASKQDATAGSYRATALTVPSPSPSGGGDTSTSLLVPPGEEVLSAQSSFSHIESCDSHSDTEVLLQNPQSGGRSPRKSSKVEGLCQESRKKSLSLDRKLSASLKELSSSLKESSHFIYKNLKIDEDGDGTQC